MYIYIMTYTMYNIVIATCHVPPCSRSFAARELGMTGCSAEITMAMARAIKSMETKMGPITTTHINNTHGLDMI